ncbi:MAG: c-type cytochrome [Candidatus Hadarchaeum sp.]
MSHRKKRLAHQTSTDGLKQILPQIGLILTVAVVWGGLLAVLLAAPAVGPRLTFSAAGSITWDDSIGPLLAAHCVVCHGGTSRLYLETYEGALAGGRRGPAIVPGDSEASLLVQSLRGMAPRVRRMPLNRPPFPDEVIAAIASWIDAGAPRTAADVIPPTPMASATPVPSPTFTPQPGETPPPTASPTPILTATASPTTEPTSTSLPTEPSVQVGAALWPTLECIDCHGRQAGGGRGPKLAGTALTVDEVIAAVRAGPGRMPSFSEDEVSDLAVRHLYAWLQSLGAPVPTVTDTATAEPAATAAFMPTATYTPEPTDTPTPVPTFTPALPSTPSPLQPSAARGEQIWPTLECVDCHGPRAQGDFGPRLAGTNLSFEAVLARVREGKGEMPAFTPEEVSDEQIAHVYAWLRSLGSQ